MFVIPHMKIRWGRHRQNTEHTATQWLRWVHWNSTPTSTVLRSDNRSRTHKHGQREALNERHERQRRQRRQRQQNEQRKQRRRREKHGQRKRRKKSEKREKTAAARVDALAAIVEQEVRETARAEQQAEQTAQMALAIQQLVSAVAQKTSSQVNQDEEESKDTSDEKLGAIPKKIVTRSQVREKVNFTAPMVEVAGPDGSVMVYRPWTVTDMKEAMAHLPSPDDAGDRFSDWTNHFLWGVQPHHTRTEAAVSRETGGHKLAQSE